MTGRPFEKQGVSSWPDLDDLTDLLVATERERERLRVESRELQAQVNGLRRDVHRLERELSHERSHAANLQHRLEARRRWWKVRGL